MTNEEFALKTLQEAAGRRPGKPVAKTTSDEYDPAALRAEVDAMKQERMQERAEVALLRAQVARYEDTVRETEAQKAKMIEFLAWVALTAEQKTQLAADKKFAGMAGDLWEVQLQEHPKVRLPAHSEYEAVGRYNEITGITGTAHKHTATCVGARPAKAEMVVPGMTREGHVEVSS